MKIRFNNDWYKKFKLKVEQINQVPGKSTKRKSFRKATNVIKRQDTETLVAIVMKITTLALPAVIGFWIIKEMGGIMKNLTEFP